MSDLEKNAIEEVKRSQFEAAAKTIQDKFSTKKPLKEGIFSIYSNKL